MATNGREALDHLKPQPFDIVALGDNPGRGQRADVEVAGQRRESRRHRLDLEMVVGHVLLYLVAAGPPSSARLPILDFGL
jgi:hypothetical protein